MYYEVKSNKFSIYGDVPGGISAIVSCLGTIIDKSGHQDVEIDLSDARRIDPGFSLMLVSKVHRYRQMGVNFDITPPRDNSLRRVLYSSNFFHNFDPGRYKEVQAKISYNLPISHFLDHDQQNRIINNAMDRIIQCIDGLKRHQMSALEWSLNEITENVLSHSESATGGLVQIVSFPNRGFVGLYVADNGIGIPASMKKSHPNLQMDTQTIDRAIREGVTSKKGLHQGNGLFGTFECCKLGKGEMEIYSGMASATYKKNVLSVKREQIIFHGTFIKALINYQTEQLLTRALVFRGKKHVPNDYLDITYQEYDGNRVIFPMSSVTTGYGTRSSGMKIKNILKVLSDEFSNGITLDFSDTPVLSASFADELFGRIVSEFGEDIYTRNIKFFNISSENRLIINRAISLRADEFEK